jgi:type IV secretion system protein VirB8
VKWSSKKEQDTSKTVSKKVSEVVSRSVNFEATHEFLIRRSERRAWIVAGFLGLLLVILAGGYVALLPLKEKVPYLVTANPYTGASYVTRLPNHADGELTVPSSEAIAKANIASFVIARESYDWNLFDKRDGLVMYAMTSGEVQRQWLDLFADQSRSPDVIYGQAKVARAVIKSIILTNPDRSGAYTGATVNFDRIVYERATGTRVSGESYIATLSFKFSNALKMSEELRLQNPLGFQVTSYRLDPAIGGSSGDVILRDAINLPSAASLANPKKN